MKRQLSKTLFGLLMAALAIFATGCETIQPHGITMDSLENYGGGGGGDS
jgi:hypothetical protein